MALFEEHSDEDQPFYERMHSVGRRPGSQAAATRSAEPSPDPVTSPVRMMADMDLRVGTRSTALGAAYAAAVGPGWTTVPVPGTENLAGEELAARLRGALFDGDCDLIVHSASDLPAEDHPGLMLVFPRRDSPHDAFCGPTDYRGVRLGGRVGVDSANRAAQLRHFRADIDAVVVDGDIPSRLDLVGHSLDGIVVSRAQLDRLGLDGQDLPYEVMVPAAGQGALAIETVAGSRFAEIIAPLTDERTSLEMVAERTFTRQLGIPASAPVGVLARSTGRTVALHARFIGDGSKVEIRRSSNDPVKLAVDLAAEFAKRGVRP